MVKKRIRVLIVEDNEATAYLIRTAFLRKSATVDWDLCFSKDGEEALDCIFKRGAHSEAILPDLILLDWNLPKVHGQEVLRKLKSTEELRTLPVLVFSTSEADLDVHEAYNSHANGYIAKPADMDAFYAVIENIETFWVHTVRLPPKRG
jgi:CheY-like chemotaxis protein